MEKFSWLATLEAPQVMTETGAVSSSREIAKQFLPCTNRERCASSVGTSYAGWVGEIGGALVGSAIWRRMRSTGSASVTQAIS
jgi:hypothetical protein